MKKSLAVAAVAMIALPWALSAQTVTSIDAAFSNSNPGSPDVEINNGNPDDVLACWGRAALADCSAIGEGSSGYRYGRADAPFAAVSSFSLGMFTHDNFAILPPILRTIDLNVDFSVSGLGDVVAQWNIAHNETTNSEPCSVVPSASVCDDVVTLSWDETQQSVFNFNSGGSAYTLVIDGWGASAETATLTYDFQTPEFASTSVNLWATITESAIVPEPSSFALMGLGLAGLGAAARRRRNA